MVIIAEEQPTADASAHTVPQLAGSCAVVLKILDSFLPPPFPTRQPARLYIGNLVVRESQRRQGCGTALLQAVDKLGAPPLAPRPLQLPPNLQLSHLERCQFYRMSRSCLACPTAVVTASVLRQRRLARCRAAPRDSLYNAASRQQHCHIFPPGC